MLVVVDAAVAVHDDADDVEADRAEAPWRLSAVEPGPGQPPQTQLLLWSHGEHRTFRTAPSAAGAGRLHLDEYECLAVHRDDVDLACDADLRVADSLVAGQDQDALSDKPTSCFVFGRLPQ